MCVQALVSTWSPLAEFCSQYRTASECGQARTSWSATIFSCCTHHNAFELARSLLRQSDSGDSESKVFRDSSLWPVPWQHLTGAFALSRHTVRLDPMGHPPSAHEFPGSCVLTCRASWVASQLHF